MTRKTFILGMVCGLLTACSATQHHRDLPSVKDRALTVGLVQREVRQGMAPDAVAVVLGSPNIVTSSPQGETWIYDRVSTETAYSTSSGGISALILGSGTDVSAVGAPGFRHSSGATSQTQRTLTIIIRFAEGRVNDFSYHASRF